MLAFLNNLRKIKFFKSKAKQNLIFKNKCVTLSDLENEKFEYS